MLQHGPKLPCMLRWVREEGINEGLEAHRARHVGVSCNCIHEDDVGIGITDDVMK